MRGSYSLTNPARTRPGFFAATDPVGGMDHSLPINPDHGSSKPLEYWEDQLYKRQPRKRPPQPPPAKPAEDDHQIDDYA